MAEPDRIPAGASLSGILLRGGLVALAIQGGGQLLRYLWQMGFARWMGVAEYGSFSFAFGWIQVLAVLGTLGLATGALRFVPEYTAGGQWSLLRGILRRAPQITFLAGLGVAAAGTGILFLLPLEAGRREVLVLGMWVVPLLALGNLKLEITRGTRDVARAYLPQRVVLPLLSGALGYITWLRTGGLTAAQGVFALAGALVFTLLLQERFLGQALPTDPQRAVPEYRTRFWLSESFPLLLIAGFVILLNQTDVILVGALMGDEAVGRYAGAAVTSRWVNFTLLSANAVAAPMIAGLHAQGESVSLQAVVTKVSRWAFWPSLALGLILILAGGPLLGLFGEGFEAARWALAILVVGQLVNACMGPVGHLMNLTGHGRESARVYGVAAAVNLVLNIILIPRWGLEGAALATSVSVILWNVWLYVLVRRRLGIHSFFLGSGA